MGTSVSGIQPSSLTPDELVRYGYLALTQDGLPKDWCEALIGALDECLERLEQLDARIDAD